MGQTLANVNKSMASQYPIVCGEDVMSQKAHGTTEKPVQQELRYGCDF